jgi:hypothetical protein
MPSKKRMEAKRKKEKLETQKVPVPPESVPMEEGFIPGLQYVLNEAKEKLGTQKVPVPPESVPVEEGFIPGLQYVLNEASVETRDDPWEHRAVKMRCRTCMFFVLKGRDSLGRCRRHAPIVALGYPAVYLCDWCGDHKIDETKI